MKVVSSQRFYLVFRGLRSLMTGKGLSALGLAFFASTSFRVAYFYQRLSISLRFYYLSLFCWLKSKKKPSSFRDFYPLLGLVFLYIGMSACQQATTTSKNAAALCTATTPVSVAQLQNLPSPHRYTSIGNSHLPITTQHKDAQQWFDQGLNHLHDFWHLEAFRAFNKVIQLDPDCAMGHWGLAMCKTGFGNADPIWRNSIERALALKAEVTPLEQALIEASAVLIKEGIGEKAVQAFRSLYQRFPDEPEAIAFAAIMLRQQESAPVQQEVKALLERNIQRFPEHVGLLHYYLHVMELRPEFAQAIPAAQKMLSIAPQATHLIHMPGHLYYLAGQYPQAIAAYQAALTQEEAYHQGEKIPFSYNQNYLHNLHFLAVAQAEMGDYPAALKTAKRLAGLNFSQPSPNDGAVLMYSYEGRILPAQVHLRFRNWPQAIESLNQALNLTGYPNEPSLAKTYFRVIKLYAQGMEALQQKQIPQATDCGMQLSRQMYEFEQMAQQYQNTPEFKSINETWDIMSMFRYELAGWIDNLDPAKPFVPAAWDDALELQKAIRYDEPPRLFYPIEESLARLHLQRGNASLAAQAQQQALHWRPHSTLIASLPQVPIPPRDD